MAIIDLSCFPGVEQSTERERGRSRITNPPSELVIPKNRSTGNLLAHGTGGVDRSRIRFSFDAGMGHADLDSLTRLVLSCSHAAPEAF